MSNQSAEPDARSDVILAGRKAGLTKTAIEYLWNIVRWAEDEGGEFSDMDLLDEARRLGAVQWDTHNATLDKVAAKVRALPLRASEVRYRDAVIGEINEARHEQL